MAKAAAKSIRNPTNVSMVAIPSCFRALRNDAGSLAALYDAYVAAAEAMSSVINQPRAEAAETAIDHEREALLQKAAVVTQLLAALSPVDSREKSDRARALTHWAFLCGNGLDDEIIALVERHRVC